MRKIQLTRPDSRPGNRIIDSIVVLLIRDVSIPFLGSGRSTELVWGMIVGRAVNRAATDWWGGGVTGSCVHSPEMQIRLHTGQ